MPRFVILRVREVGVNRAQTRLCPIVSYAIGLVQARIEALWRLRGAVPVGLRRQRPGQTSPQYRHYKARKSAQNESRLRAIVARVI
jgi:hypothetical protein